MSPSRQHSASFEVIAREPNVWQARCGRHAAWNGPTYEAVEDEWRRHVHEQTGTAPKPLGKVTAPRWTPPEGERE